MINFYNAADNLLYAKPNSQFITQDRFRGNVASVPPELIEEENVTKTFGIPATAVFQNNSGGSNYPGSAGNLINNFNNQATTNVGGLDQSMGDKSFLGMRSYNENQDVNPADAGEYLAAGQDIPTRFDPTIAGRVQETLGKGKDLVGKGIGMAVNSVMGIPGLSYALGKMDRFDTLPAMDREYINQNKYYTGPTVFGENNSGLGKDPYGINVRSAFGNYGAYVDKMAAGYENISEEDFKKLSNFEKTKVRFYRKEKEKRAIDLEIAQSDAAAADDKANNQAFQNAMAQGRDFYDTLNDGRGASVSDKSREEAGSGFNDVSESGPFAKGGRVGYYFGGLAARGMKK